MQVAQVGSVKTFSAHNFHSSVMFDINDNLVVFSQHTLHVNREDLTRFCTLLQK